MAHTAAIDAMLVLANEIGEDSVDFGREANKEDAQQLAYLVLEERLLIQAAPDLLEVLEMVATLDRAPTAGEKRQIAAVLLKAKGQIP